MPDGNGQPTVTEIARRLQRVEDKLDERIVTRDMLAASEKLFEARELAHAADTQNLSHRVTNLERRGDRMQNMLMGAFLVLLVNIIVLVLTIATKGAS